MMRDVLKASLPAQITASAEVEPGEYTGRVKMRGPNGGMTRGRKPGTSRKQPSLAAARAARARGVEPSAATQLRLADQIPCRGTPVTLCVSLGLTDADELDRRAKAAGMTRSSYIRHLIWGGT